MSTPLTPEAARAAADAYAAEFGVGSNRDRAVLDWFRAKADRLEAASRTPGQVAYRFAYPGYPWRELSDVERARWERIATAVIAHVVGPDRVVVDRADLQSALIVLGNSGAVGPVMSSLREALS